MKKKFFILTILMAVLTVRAVYADEIYLNDNTVLKGTVIQITDSAVEYDPDGPSAFDAVARNRVVKIIYADGTEKRLITDTIVLASGESIRCSIVRVTKDSIAYKPEGSEQEKTISRDLVAGMEFGDGRIVDLQKKTAVGPQEDAGKKPVKGFHDSIFRISVFGGGAVIEGGVADKERRVFNAYRPDLVLVYGYPIRYSQYTGLLSRGAEIDLMRPAIRFIQKRGFDFTGIKFGVRGRYGHETVASFISDKNNDTYNDSEKNNRGTLLKYHYWSAGPVMSLIFSPRSNAFNVLLSVYGMGGQVFGGRLRPMTSLRDSALLAARLSGAWNGFYTGFWNSPALMSWATLYTVRGLNNTRVRGYTIRAGFGPEISLNRHVPIIVGLRATYAYTRLDLGKAPLIYADGNKKASHHELGGEISVGFHF